MKKQSEEDAVILWHLYILNEHSLASVFQYDLYILTIPSFSE